MNYPKFELGPLNVGCDDIKPVLQCLIHTILFHRTLGVVHPREITSDIFQNISYMTCSSDNIYKKIEEKIEYVIDNQNNDSLYSNKSGKIIVTFYEAKTNKQWFGLNGVTKEYWERWDINLNIKSKKEIDLIKLEKNVKENIIKIIEKTNSYFQHLPKLPKQDELKSLISYPFEINIPNKKDLTYSDKFDKIFRVVKKLVDNAPQSSNN